MTEEVTTRYGDLDDNGPASKYVPPVSRETEASNSLLDELAEVAEKAITKGVTYDVDPTVRPGGWRLSFEAVISEKELKNYTKYGGGGKIGTDLSKVENAKATAYALVEKNTGIFKGNEQVLDSDGDPLTLTSTEWLSKVGKQTEKNYDAIKAILAFLGDAQVISMGSALMSAAGYNEQMEAVDPTFG